MFVRTLTETLAVTVLRQFEFKRSFQTSVCAD